METGEYRGKVTIDYVPDDVWPYKVEVVGPQGEKLFGDVYSWHWWAVRVANHWRKKLAKRDYSSRNAVWEVRVGGPGRG